MTTDLKQDLLSQLLQQNGGKNVTEPARADSVAKNRADSVVDLVGFCHQSAICYRYKADTDDYGSVDRFWHCCTQMAAWDMYKMYVVPNI